MNKAPSTLFQLGPILIGFLLATSVAGRAQQPGSLLIQIADKQVQVNYQLPASVSNLTWNATYTDSGVTPIIVTPFRGFIGFQTNQGLLVDNGIRYQKMVMQDSLLRVSDSVILPEVTTTFSYQGSGQWEEKRDYLPNPPSSHTFNVPSFAAILASDPRISDATNWAVAETDTKVVHYVWASGSGYGYFPDDDPAGGNIYYMENILDLTLSNPINPVTTGGDSFTKSYAGAGIPTVNQSGTNSTTAVYNVTVPSGMTGTIRWFEVFSPASNPDNKQYTAREWMIDGTSLTSPNFTLIAPSDGSSTVVPYTAQLAVDANRDYTIKFASEDNSDATSVNKPYLLRLNDDHDSGSSDVLDYSTGVVNGANDLKDFYPIILDVKQLITAFPPSDSVKYKLKQEDAALNFVYTNLNRATAFSFRDSAQLTIGGFGPLLIQAAASATAQQVTSDGVELSAAFLNQINSLDQCEILIEGRKLTDRPLVLSVEKDGKSITELKLDLCTMHLGKIWETSNKANQIFNPTRKDDPNDPTNPILEIEGDGDATYGIPRNNLYVVADASDNMLKVSLDLGVAATSRNKFIAAAWDGTTKVSGSDASFPSDTSQPANLLIPASMAAEIKEYQVRIGLDANGNGLLDDNEAFPIEIYRRKDSGKVGYATVTGVSNSKYEANKNSIVGDADSASAKLAVPHGQTLLSRFVYGDFLHANSNYVPADGDISPVTLDPFHNSTATDSDYCEWLTHNSGAHFENGGPARDMDLAVWRSNSSFSDWIAGDVSPLALNTIQLVMGNDPSLPPTTTLVPTNTNVALQAFYNATVKPLALADLTPKADGDVYVSDWYDFPMPGNAALASLNPNPLWPQSTVLLGEEASETQVPGSIAAVVATLAGNLSAITNYDGFITGGRVRMQIQYQFQVQRVPKLFGGFDLTVVRLLSRGTVEDLYDFNFEIGGLDSLSQKAATIQIGSGAGVGSRTMPGHGHIFRVRWELNSISTNPF